MKLGEAKKCIAAAEAQHKAIAAAFTASAEEKANEMMTAEPGKPAPDAKTMEGIKQGLQIASQAMQECVDEIDLTTIKA